VEVSVFNTFFPIVDTCRSCEDTARGTCEMEPTWRFLRPVFQRAACSTFQKYGRHPISGLWD